MSSAENFIRLVTHPLKFRLFLLTKLPSAFFCGVKVKSISYEQTQTAVPYSWISQNPFKSTYFACLAMAAELSTGLLAMLNIYERQPRVSMLVTGLEAVYHKKATSVTIFTCEDGIAISSAIERSRKSGEAESFKARSTGRNENGELIAEFFITWSFKCKP
jgi:hypothetical protein